MNDLVGRKGGRPTRIMSKILDTAMYTEGTYTEDSDKTTITVYDKNQLFFNQSATFEYEGAYQIYRLEKLLESTSITQGLVN